MRWPVVLTVGGHDAVRAGFAQAVLASWTRHAQADVLVLDGGIDDAFRAQVALWSLPLLVDGAPLDTPTLQRERHRRTLEIGRARGARYVWGVDDDCLGRPEMDLDVAAALLDSRPDMWLVAVDLPSCPLPHGADGAHHTAPLVETGSVGGLRVFRVDAFRDFVWPTMDPHMGGRFDVPLCCQIRAAGGKVGFFGDASPRHLRAQHLGEFVSTFEWPYPRARIYPRRWDE